MAQPAKERENKAEYITTGNVLDDLGFTPEKAASLKRKAEVWSVLHDEIRAKKYSPKDLVEKLDEYQPQVSNLLSGKISKVSLDKLLHYCDRLGVHVAITVQPKLPASAKITSAKLIRKSLPKGFHLHLPESRVGVQQQRLGSAPHYRRAAANKSKTVPARRSRFT